MSAPGNGGPFGLPATPPSGNTVRDRLWTVGPVETSIDEFNDALLDPAWVRVDKSGGTARATWTEGADVLSVKNAGGDSTAELHALLRPVVTAPATGDAFITAFRLFGTGASNFLMGGILLADGTTFASGTQVGSLGYATGGSTSQTNNGWTWTGFQTNVTNSSSQNSLNGCLTFHRLVYLGSNTWRVDISPDGVSWIIGSTWTQALTSTHVGLLSSSWGTSTVGITSYEFFRRVAGVT